jgi:hypothetical protein
MAHKVGHLSSMLNRKQPPPIAETAEIILALDRREKPLPLREQPAYAAKMAEIARAAGVRDRARQRDEHARARRLNPPPSRGAVDRMKDLAAGAVIPGTDPAHEQQAAREEVAIARAAEAALHGELAEITSELSYQYSQRLVAQNRATMVALYENLCQTAAAVAALQGLHVTMLQQGYQPNPALLPSYLPNAACQIGAPADQNSQVALLRRWLADQGWI